MMERIFFRPNKIALVILVLLYLVCILSYYFVLDNQSQAIIYLLAVSLPVCTLILYGVSSRWITITPYDITLHQIGPTHTTCFHKIQSMEYRQSFWRGGRYLHVEYIGQYGMPSTMDINGDYNLEVIEEIIKNSQRIL